MSLHTVSDTLTATPPFDFSHSLYFLERFGPAMGQQTTGDGVLTRALSHDGRLIAFRVRSTGTTGQPALDYTLLSEADLTDDLRQYVEDYIAFVLSLNDDLTPFYSVGRDDPSFAPIVQKLYGYHQVKFPTPFENAVWAILSQRNTMSLSEKMKQALTEWYGDRIELDASLYRAFPEPAQLAGLRVDELAAVIRHGPKAESILDAAHHFASIDEAFLREAGYDDVYRWLRQIRGIGDWSASFILLRGLGRMEHLTRGEKRVLDAASRVYQRPVTQETLERLGERYGSWKGYWAHYLRVAS
jgi:DNA-3-methyladenine glycosylase II